jgi:hypothetical protein
MLIGPDPYPERSLLVLGHLQPAIPGQGEAQGRAVPSQGVSSTVKQRGKTMSKVRQFTAHDAVESKQTGDIQLDKTPGKLTEEDLQEVVGGTYGPRALMRSAS